MTHHLDGIPGLLAPARTFYVERMHAETGAYALEWINAFAHLDKKLTSAFVLHGGTLAQLYLNEFQRLSRDVDLIGMRRGGIEQVLDAIATRYSRRLFTWEETHVADTEVDLQRFSVFFPSAREPGVLVPLKIDVTYLPIRLTTQFVRLGQSKIYVPGNTNDSAETLTPAAFIADKLPTLGFDTLGYSRGGGVLGHSDQVWKQMHDISGLVDASADLEAVLPLFSEGVRVRNTARRMNHSLESCLNDTWRVSSIGMAAATYPRNEERAGDEHYAEDVQELRAGLGGYRAYCLREPVPLEIASRCGLLARGLAAVGRGDCRADGLRAIFDHVEELGARARAEEPTRKVLRMLLGRPGNPPGWTAPVASRLAFGLAPAAAIAVYVAGRLSEETKALASTGRFSFEPGD